MTTKVPTIPTITDGDVTQILSSVKMLLDVREGRVGDRLDANVTYRDLVGLNLVKDPTGSVIYTGATGAAASLPVRPFGTDSDGYDPTADLTPPPAPESVSALGSIGAIFLSWSTPAYKNHAFAEIWRSGIDDVATAVLIGTSPTQGFVDIPGDNLPRYYWIRFASRADVRGPYSQTSVSATASPDPAVLIAAISGQITESSLAQSLSQRISTIESSKDLVGSLQNTVARLKGLTDTAISQEQATRSQAILNEQIARVNGLLAEAMLRETAITSERNSRIVGDSIIASSVETLTAKVDQSDAILAAAIQNESVVRTSEIASEAALRETLASRVSSAEGSIQINSAAIANEQVVRTTQYDSIAYNLSLLNSDFQSEKAILNARINEESAVRTDAISSVAQSVQNLSAIQLADNNVFAAAIQNEASARATSDSALTSSISTLQVAVNQNSIAISAEAAARANADGSLFAQYTVKIDANGHVSGFGLASGLVNGAPTSAFIVRADKFAVVDPASTANNLTNDPSSDAVPFAVSGGVVYLKSAMIENGSITNAKISTLAANKITAGNINATIGINGGKVYGAELYAGGTVAVENDGSFTANNPTVKIAGGNATFVASNFKISNSASGTPTDYTPFEVVNDVVRINTALIANATISLAQIDTANITNLSSIKADMGTITAGKMQSSDGKFVIDLDNKTISIEV